ncbi:MAG: DUF2330 domain-containing protein [Deltaproteobacteria bacterium]|nr:DUF2330 domain-containing protein [Deltaproteobacteria bacterium]
MPRLRVALTSGLLVASVLGALAVTIDPARVQACGGFFTKRLSADRAPSLAYEQVIIVHDAAKNREHFVREVAFRKADEPFGFVVPTPTRPEVDKVHPSLLKDFRIDFPFEPIARGLGIVGAGGGTGGGAGFGGRGVTVLEKKKVGSFTAFVLAADDSAALSGWLEQHGLSTTPHGDAWLAHYVAMKFFYVAMRYDPPKQAKGDGMLAAETMRISFDTPVPYYPYLEPATPPGIVGDERLLDLWVVSSKKVVPLAVRERGNERTWIRPLREGESHPDARRKLDELAALEGLLPEGDLVVQTFQDQKRSRAGIGDILFAPAQKTEVSAQDRAALGTMLAILDPALLEAP